MVNLENDDFTSVKWIDFGLLVFAANKATQDWICALHGTRSIDNDTYDERIDIWSLGVCTFCMISCRHPFVPDLCDETFRQFKSENLKIRDIFKNYSLNPFSYSSNSSNSWTSSDL